MIHLKTIPFNLWHIFKIRKRHQMKNCVGKVEKKYKSGKIKIVEILKIHAVKNVESTKNLLFLCFN